MQVYEISLDCVQNHLCMTLSLAFRFLSEFSHYCSNVGRALIVVVAYTVGTAAVVHKASSAYVRRYDWLFEDDRKLFRSLKESTKRKKFSVLVDS